MLKAIALKFSIAWDLLVFLWNFKMWWMIPMESILLFFGLLIVVRSATGVGPFIYTLF